MTTDTAALSVVLGDLPDAPDDVRQTVGTELLYALALIPRPDTTEENTR